MAGVRPASRPAATPGLRLHLGKPGRGFPDIGGEVGEFLHLADLDHFVVIPYEPEGRGVA
jgi:hypothetical protein